MLDANAQIGVATANFFPQLGLTALLGQASTPLSQITAGQANVWSIAANFAGPIYQGGALRAQKRQTVAAWEQSKFQYEQAALNAFTDVANTLISRTKFEAIRTEQARSVAAYQEAVKISLQRYQAGKASYFEVLEAQIQLYPEQRFRHGLEEHDHYSSRVHGCPETLSAATESESFCLCGCESLARSNARDWK